MCINCDYSTGLVGFGASNSTLEELITLNKAFSFFFSSNGSKHLLILITVLVGEVFCFSPFSGLLHSS